MSVAAALVASLALVAGASAGDMLLRPGIAIGKLRLGMLETDARRAYSFPYIERETRPFGRERVTISFGLSGYSAVLYGPERRARVVQVATSSAAERTWERIGVGSSEAQLRAEYGKRLSCTGPHAYVYQGLRRYGPGHECSLRGDGVETIFKIVLAGRPGTPRAVRTWDAKKALIREVVVQVKPLPR